MTEPRKRFYGLHVIEDEDRIRHFSREEVEARVQFHLEKINARQATPVYQPGEVKNNDATIIQPDSTSQAQIAR